MGPRACGAHVELPRRVGGLAPGTRVSVSVVRRWRDQRGGEYQQPGDNEPGLPGGRGDSSKPARAVRPRMPTRALRTRRRELPARLPPPPGAQHRWLREQGAVRGLGAAGGSRQRPPLRPSPRPARAQPHVAGDCLIRPLQLAPSRTWRTLHTQRTGLTPALSLPVHRPSPSPSTGPDHRQPQRPIHRAGAGASSQTPLMAALCSVWSERTNEGN